MDDQGTGQLPFAEDINYWKTGKSPPDLWMDKAKLEIIKAGGVVLRQAFGEDIMAGRAAYMLRFSVGDDEFKVVWPVLPVKKSGDERAARIQAATMLYHDVKSRCISARVLGMRASFFSYLVLPNGFTASQVSSPKLLEILPHLLGPGA